MRNLIIFLMLLIAVPAFAVQPPECTYEYDVNWFYYDWATQWATRIVIKNLSHTEVAHVKAEVLWDKDIYEFELQPRESVEHTFWLEYMPGKTGDLTIYSDQRLAVTVIVWGVCDGNHRMTDVNVYEIENCPQECEIVEVTCPECPSLICPEIPDCTLECPDVECCNECDCDEINPPKSDYKLIGGPDKDTYVVGWATNGEYRISLKASNESTTWTKREAFVCTECLDGPETFFLHYDLRGHSATNVWVEVDRLGECEDECELPAEQSFLLDNPIGDPAAECAYFGSYVPGTAGFYVTKCGSFYEVSHTPWTANTCSNGQEVSHSTECECAE